MIRFPNHRYKIFFGILIYYVLVQAENTKDTNHLYAFVEEKADQVTNWLYRKIKKGPLGHGHFSMIVGNSCFGKSLVLIKLQELLKESGGIEKPYVFCQPLVDRNDLITGVIRSRNNKRMEAVSFDTKEKIEQIFHDHDIVVVDEIQLTPHDLQSFFLKELHLFLDRGGLFIAAGLDYNSLGGEFIFSALPKTRAHKTHHLQSLCNMCGKPADRFDQHLINGIPANVNMPDFVGPTDYITYEPSCSDCLIVEK